MDDRTRRSRLAAISDALSLGRLERHVFLCADQTTPRCAPRDQAVRVWKYLKKRLKELGLSDAPPAWKGQGDGPPPETPPGTGCVYRSKVDCLRVCEQGPIAVVYPDGTWYHSVTEEVMERILTEHVIGGLPVEEFMFARAPLGGGPARPRS